MKIEMFTAEQIDLLENDWKRLQQGEDMTIFQSFQWNKWLTETYFKESVKNIFRKWVYFTAKDENQIVMIAPVQVVNVGVSLSGIGLERGGGISSGDMDTLII